MPVRFTRIILSVFTCSSLRHFQLESRVCLLPFAVNFTLNLSNVLNFSWDDCNTQEK